MLERFDGLCLPFTSPESIICLYVFSVFRRIFHIHRWYHWNRQHMAVMMLVFLLVDHGHIYSVVFMNKIIYHMLWAMQRALEKAYRHVNKTKQFTERYIEQNFISSVNPIYTKYVRYQTDIDRTKL